MTRNLRARLNIREIRAIRGSNGFFVYFVYFAVAHLQASAALTSNAQDSAAEDLWEGSARLYG
jgi:hypothetical protein